MTKLLPKALFTHFYCQSCSFLRLWILELQIRRWSVLQQNLKSIFLCLDRFNILVPPMFSFLTTLCHSKPLSSTTFNSWRNHFCLEQWPFHLNVLKNLWKLLELCCHATVLSHLSLLGLLIWSCKPHWTWAIFCSAKVLKFVKSKQQDGNKLTIQPLVSHGHLTIPKTNLTKQCKSLSKSFVSYRY